MFSVFDVANEFLSINSVSHKKLQKLCYYAQGWNLGLLGTELFNEEIQAWIHGPVCPTLYNKYRGYGYEEIPKEESNNTDENFKRSIGQIYRIYEDLDGDDLEAKTHNEFPWKNARHGLQSWESCNREITKLSMKLYFKEEFSKIASA